MSASEKGGMLRVRDVAERLNVSAQCVYQLVESGKLTVHRIGVGRGAIRVSESDLNQFLEESRHGKRPRTPAPPERLLKHIKL